MACCSILLAVVGCSRSALEAPTGGSAVPPSKTNLKRHVEVFAAPQKTLVYYVETVGVLEPEGQTEIAAGVAGVVDEVLFREGDEVTPQTVLVRVDQRRYIAAMKVAEANVQRAMANLALARDLERRALQAGAGASLEEKAKARLALNIAEAELQSAQAALDLARHNLDRSQVRAPYAGRINQRRVTSGTYLEERTVIATLADLSRIRLVGWVPETAAPQLRELMNQQEQRLTILKTTLPLGGWLSSPFAGLALLAQVQRGIIPSGYDPEFTLLAFPQQTFTARIFYMSTVANPDTHMFEWKAEVDVQGEGAKLRPGYTARIRIPLRSNPEAVVVPEEAVRATERGFVVFVPVMRTGRDGQSEWIARARTLDLGHRSPGWVEVRRGLAPGELLVRRGAEALEDGTPIRFEKRD